MTELMDSVANLGVLVVIAVIFIYDHLSTSKKTEQIQQNNNELLKQQLLLLENQSKTLDILLENTEKNYKKDIEIERKIDCIKEKANIVKKGGF